MARKWAGTEQPPVLSSIGMKREDQRGPRRRRVPGEKRWPSGEPREGHAGPSADRLHKTRRLGGNQRSAPQHRPSTPGNSYPGDTQIEAGRPHEARVAAISTTVYAAIANLPHHPGVV